MRFADDTAVTWVLAPTVVTGLRRPFEPLTRDAFRLEIDGEEVAIESFDVGRENPMSLLFFQDLSGSMANGGKLAASQRALCCHLDTAKEGDEMAVVTFASGSILVDVPLTAELAVVAEQAASWRAYGTTALHDAIAWIPDIHLSPGKTPAAILLTDGIDNASVLDAEAARSLVRRAQVPVYVLALRGRRAAPRRSAAREKPSTANEFLPYARVLRRLAESTGGSYFEIHRPDDVDRACAAITEELRNRYTLGFPLSTQGEETYHGLRITLPGHSVQLRHRAGYLGLAPN